MQQQTKTPASYTLSLEEVQALQFRVSTHRAKAKIGKLTPETVREYERRVEQLREGADVGSACKKERYLWKAAGEWGFKTRMRALLIEADKARSAKGVLEVVRMLGWKAKVQEMDRLAREWEIFSKNSVWKTTPVEIIRKQSDHKKAPATDAQLAAFHGTKTAQKSQYRDHFIAAEFCGARPEEFGGSGLGVEVIKHEDADALRFWIEGAKQGEGKGQPLRSVVVPYPAEAAEEVKARWTELRKTTEGMSRKRLLLRVQASEKLTAGQKLSRAFANCAKKMEGDGPALSMYSLRQRVSAQAKESNEDPVKVAELMGHQSTETQRHYAKGRRRGGSAISPVRIISDGAGVLEKVRNYRDRKGNPIKPKKAPAPAVPPTPNLAALRRGGPASISRPLRGPRPPG